MKALFIGILLLWGISFSGESGFTQEDREKLIRLEAILKTFMYQVDRRFEQVDKRIGELREDMNARLEQMDRRISELREDTNKRFEQLYTFLRILTGVFTTLTVSVIGLAYWDRRNIIRKAREETLEHLERE